VHRWTPLLNKAGIAARRVLKRPDRRGYQLPTAPEVTDATTPVRRVPGATLRTEGLTVRFGDTTALADLSIEVRPGEVVGLIGPNGAGKTTAIDAITGFVRRSAGTIHLGDEDLTRRSARQRAEARLARSFQSLELFEDLTVAENLLVFTEGQSWRHYLTDLFWPRRPRFSPTALDAIALFDLQDDLDRLPTELSYGRRRLVATPRPTAAEPAVLLLDEPAAGLSQTESAELKTLLRHLADDRGMGVLLVEHDVDLVMSSCDRVVALVFGRQVASGTPAEVRQDPQVVQAYLGVGHEDDGAADGPADGDTASDTDAGTPSLAAAAVSAGATDDSQKEIQA
jgi:sulfate-transporting ATPase